MKDPEPLLRAISDLEGVLFQCVSIVAENAEDHRREMIQIRRSLTQQTSDVLALGLETFEDEESREAFRASHSKLRTAIALHQSSWPLSSFKPDDPSYEASLRGMRIAYEDFIASVRATLRKAGRS